MIIHSFLLLSSVLALTTGAPSDPRFFSLLNLVRFENLPCAGGSSTAGNTVVGTCFSNEECTNLGGRVDGTCASGFGVCCVFSLNACGGAVTNNCTYITNPGAPSGFTGTAAMCQYTFARGTDDVCRIRLDFDTLVVSPPNTVPANLGQCNIDSVAVSSTSLNNLPLVCGTLTGQHMYITPSAMGDLGTLDLNFDTTVTTVARRWNIKVTRVACADTLSIPPDGCLQYFTGMSGTVRSYNFGTLLASQAYNTCIRTERGFCDISYTESMPKTSFGLAATQKSICKNSRLIVQSSPGSTICGTVFTSNPAGTVPSTVTGSNSNPHILRLETPIKITKGGLVGYSLNYAQGPC
eukprot:TRINITY_DN18698_c0_g1_i1.p1 TRINITY_DN18698_c0_g1~~TRINITY_DN18698_c0_g1_i1.p1  ORF type:complete len:351 (-),score=33.66 TRINITY_DN18698_c0_g1_i1:21-1073(-)